MRLATVEFGALATAAVRVAIASAFLLPILILRGQLPVLARHWKVIFLIGLLNSGIPFALFAYALLSITSGMSAILNATVPMFGALVAWLWLKDRPTASRALGYAQVLRFLDGECTEEEALVETQRTTRRFARRRRLSTRRAPRCTSRRSVSRSMP